mgnify:FL=1
MKKVALMMLVALCLGAGGVTAAEPAKPEGKAAATRPGERCAPETGSRISRKADAYGRCDSGSQAVRSYDQEELYQTGEVNVGEALNKLDPRLTGR